MNRRILRLAIPNILSNLSVPMLGVADTALMGRMDSAIYLGAIALGGILFNFIYWGFGFLRMGTTGLTAQEFGRQDRAGSMAVFVQAILVALGSGLMILLMNVPIGWLGFRLIGGSPEVLDVAREYYEIRILAAPATLALFVVNGWFLGMQNARDPMVLTVFANALNIGLNFLMVYGLGMKADGVALATVIAQYSAAGLAVLIFMLRYKSYLPLINVKASFSAAGLLRFFKVNRDIFIRTLCLIFTFSFFTARSAAIDDLTLAVNQVLLQFFYVMSYGVDGFAFAAESLTGRYIGAKDPVRLRQALKLLFRWGLGGGLVFALFYLLAGETMLRLFTDKEYILAAARPYLLWMSVLSLTGAAAFLWDGVYIGATASVSMRNIMLLSTVGVFLPVYFLAFPALGNHGLWLAMAAFMLSRSLLMGAFVNKQVLGRAG